MALQANAIQKGWSLASLKKSQILKAAHAIRAQAAKIYKCKVTEILLSVCLEMARKGEKLKVEAKKIAVRVYNNTWSIKELLGFKGWGLVFQRDGSKEWHGEITEEQLKTLKTEHFAQTKVSEKDGKLLVKIPYESQIVKITTKPAATWDGWCNKCQSYCWGDCEASQN